MNKLGAPPTKDTIFALSTAEGRAGIAVLRISGPLSAHTVEQITKKPAPSPRQAAHRLFYRPGTETVVDDGVVIFFKGPASYTGEDSAEFHCHGGLAIVSTMLDALAAQPGLRMAEAGEFSRRAFENGKLDLTQVEAVADLIDAETEAQRAQAQRQYGGALSAETEKWRETLVRAMAHMEAEIDFPDEDLPEGVAEKVRGPVAELKSTIEEHLKNKSGERLRRGLDVAIIGAPNAGKSSFLNRLTGREAAIVTSVPGTTRDIVEVHLDFRGLPLTLADTAGLRSTEDIVEAEGVRRAAARAENADLVILMVDAGKSETMDEIQPDLTLYNKVDETSADIPAGAYGISVKTGTGWEDAMAALENTARAKLDTATAPLITRTRHRAAFTECAGSLGRFLEMHGIAPPELAAEELRQAARALGRVAGTVDVEDLLDVVFRDFCIGK